MKTRALLLFAVCAALSLGAHPAFLLLALPGQDPQLPEIVFPRRPALPPAAHSHPPTAYCLLPGSPAFS